MKVRYFNIAILNVFLLVTLSVSVYGSVHNTFYGQAAPISAETPKVVLQSGTAGTSIIYTNNTSAKVSVAAPAPVPTYFPSGYSVLSGNWWNLSYCYRKRITVVNNAGSSLSSGHSVCVTIDTASLVSAGKMMTSGNDLRIVWWNSTSQSYVELDRANETDFNLASTKIWFKLQKDIAASSSDNNYYLYYGYSGAANPPNDWAKVYDVGDDFNDGTVTSGLNTTTSGVASITETEGECFMDLETSDADAGMIVTNNPLPADKKFMIRYKVNLVSLGSSQELKTFSINQWDGRPTVCVNTIYNPTRRIHVLQYATYLKLVYEGTGGRMHWNGTNWTSTVSTLPCSVNTYYIWEFISNGTNWYVVWKYANETVIQQTDLVAWSSVTDNGHDWWFLWSEPYTNYWWGDIKVDFFYLRDYVSPEPTTNLENEESSYHVSGTVPTSVQNVDSDYLIIRSASSGTASTEFALSNMTKNAATQLNFTVVSEYDIENVNVTIQAWNYSSSAYVTSGEGYLTYTSTGVNETKLLSINTNPQFYTSNGYAKIKVTGVKSTTTQFQQKTNQIKLDYRYSASNYALDYDGSNDYVEVPDSASLDITDKITIDAWIRPTAFSNQYPGIVCKWDWSGTNPQRSYSLYLTGYNKVWFMLSNDALWHDEYSLQSSTVLSTDTWYYIAGVYNGSVMKLYINGVKDAEKNAILTIYSGTAKLSIGSSMTDGSVATDETFNGIIDEVRISNVSRSASEISANWNDGKGKRLEADANTAALWHFDEGTGDTTYDETINDNNGTLKPSYPSDCPSWVNGFSFPTQTYDHVLKVVNRFADNWTVNLQVYDSTNIDRLSSLNISLHDGTSSNQIAISGGTIIKSEGEQYNLPGGSGSTIYISINNLQATTTDTSYLYVYLKIKVPNTSTYNLFIIVFEIT